jgi:hypothetical protein
MIISQSLCTVVKSLHINMHRQLSKCHLPTHFYECQAPCVYSGILQYVIFIWPSGTLSNHCVLFPTVGFDGSHYVLLCHISYSAVCPYLQAHVILPFFLPSIQDQALLQMGFVKGPVLSKTIFFPSFIYISTL